MWVEFLSLKQGLDIRERTKLIPFCRWGELLFFDHHILWSEMQKSQFEERLITQQEPVMNFWRVRSKTTDALPASASAGQIRHLANSIMWTDVHNEISDVMFGSHDDLRRKLSLLQRHETIADFMCQVTNYSLHDGRKRETRSTWLPAVQLYFFRCKTEFIHFVQQ